MHAFCMRGACGRSVIGGTGRNEKETSAKVASKLCGGVSVDVPSARAAHIEKVVGERGYAQKVGDNRLKPTDLGGGGRLSVFCSIIILILILIPFHFIHAPCSCSLACRRLKFLYK